MTTFPQVRIETWLSLLAGIRALVKEARIRFIGGRPRKRTVDDKQMALPGF